jgi:REP element-mobilizing transposase RayT
VFKVEGRTAIRSVVQRCAPFKPLRTNAVKFGRSVLNCVVTSNHVHLLVRDTGANVVAQSMQLIAGRTAQEYNQRKNRQGAFWEDR